MCLEAGGSITGEHGVGVDKKKHMPKMFGEADLDAFQRLRCAFDPAGLAEPRQGHADAAPVRRGARARTASIRSKRRAWRSASDDGRGGRRGDPRARRRRPGRAAARRRHEARLGRGRRSAVDFDTRALNRILEHNEGDFTAILEAGVPLVEAQAAFGAAGQMLALDPPLGAGDAATIGGVIAANDSGPLRHRYGGVRDLVVGITVVLSDGTIAKSGGKVIKNVAGYDLAKLFAGSFGTLGLIARVAVRLHPAPAAHGDADRARATTRTRSPRAAAQLAALPLEADCLDVGWEGDAGWLERPLRRRPPRPSARERRARATSSSATRRSTTTTTSAGRPQRDRQRGRRSS